MYGGAIASALSCNVIVFLREFVPTLREGPSEY